jgi:formyltetrahydrofolate deformylase
VVDHADSARDLIGQGHNTKSLAPARVVKSHIRHRVLLNCNRTVVFK